MKKLIKEIAKLKFFKVALEREWNGFFLLWESTTSLKVVPVQVSKHLVTRSDLRRPRRNRIRGARKMAGKWQENASDLISFMEIVRLKRRPGFKALFWGTFLTPESY